MLDKFEYKEIFVVNINVKDRNIYISNKIILYVIQKIFMPLLIILRPQVQLQIFFILKKPI